MRLSAGSKDRAGRRICLFAQEGDPSCRLELKWTRIQRHTGGAIDRDSVCVMDEYLAGRIGRTVEVLCEGLE
jgi:hypothetical protein